MKCVRVDMRTEAEKCRAAQQGMTLLETMVAISLAAIVLSAGLVGANRYMSQRSLLGWGDIIVNDVRGAQQVSMARRAVVVVTFTAKSGSNPASYTTAVGGGTIRYQTLPQELNLTAQTLQFGTLGVPTSGSAVSVTLTNSLLGTTRTITVAPGTGTVTVQ